MGAAGSAGVTAGGGAARSPSTSTCTATSATRPLSAGASPRRSSPRRVPAATGNSGRCSRDRRHRRAIRPAVETTGERDCGTRHRRVVQPVGLGMGHPRWHQTTWEPSYEPTWSDITGDTLTLSTSPARSSVFDTAAAASLSFSLWNDRGQWAPEEHEWFMGRLVRVTAWVQGRAPVPLFYGQIQTASYGGTPQIPTIDLTALDVLAMIGAPDGGVPAAPDEERVDLRISRLLAAMNWPASRADIRPDSVLLLPDTDTRYLDVMSRAAESAGGLLTADAAGIVHYRDRYWLDGFRQLPVVYAVAVGAPPAGLDPGVPVATPSASDRRRGNDRYRESSDLRQQRRRDNGRHRHDARSSLDRALRIPPESLDRERPRHRRPRDTHRARATAPRFQRRDTPDGLADRRHGVRSHVGARDRSASPASASTSRGTPTADPTRSTGSCSASATRSTLAGGTWRSTWPRCSPSARRSRSRNGAAAYGACRRGNRYRTLRRHNPMATNPTRPADGARSTRRGACRSPTT